MVSSTSSEKIELEASKSESVVISLMTAESTIEVDKTLLGRELKGVSHGLMSGSGPSLIILRTFRR